MPDGELARTLDHHEWRLDALDKWREDVDRRLAVLESNVVTEQQARILSETIAQRSRVRLTRIQGYAVVAVGLIAVADFVRSFH